MAGNKKLKELKKILDEASSSIEEIVSLQQQENIIQKPEPKPRQRKSRKRSGGYHAYYHTIRKDQWNRWLVIQAKRKAAGMESELSVLMEAHLDDLLDMFEFEWETEVAAIEHKKHS